MVHHFPLHEHTFHTLCDTHINYCVINVGACVPLPQWKIDTVYQEDYTGLLNATEIGVRVTRDPLNIHNLTSKFPTYVHEAIEEVK